MDRKQELSMDRKQELSSYEHIRFPVPLSNDDLEAAYQKGMLRKNQLHDEAYYLGYCRNTFVAKWEEKEQAFYYMREKFGNIFPERIFHPEDDNGYDLFIPYRQVEPTAEEIIKEAVNVWPVLKKKKK